MGFWGLIVRNGRKCRQTVQKDFHVSLAVLDHREVAPDEIISLNLEVNGHSYIVGQFCMKHGLFQVPLDILLKRGETIMFSITGKSENSSVHLTGYTVEDTESPKKGESIGEKEALVNLTNKEVKNMKNTLSPKSALKSASKNLQKENEAPSSKFLNKANKAKSNDSPQTKTDKKNKAKNKDLSLTDMVNSFTEEEEEEDEDFEPEGEEEEEEGEEEEEEEEDEDDDEEDFDEDEAEMGNDDEAEDDDDDDEEGEDDDDDDTKDDTPKKKEDHDNVKSSAQNKKKRPLSPPSSAGRTPMVRGGKKQKMLDTSGSPVLPEKISKKNQNKSTNADSSFKDSAVKNSKEKQRNDSISSGEKSPKETKSKKQVLMGGVTIENLVEGTGAKAARGKKLSVFYEGKLKNGKVFDSVKGGKPFKFRLANNEVIKAWDVGLIGMKVGGKRKIIAPPGMAYGKEGYPPGIPPNSVLTFEVTLKDVS